MNALRDHHNAALSEIDEMRDELRQAYECMAELQAEAREMRARLARFEEAERRAA